MAEATTKEQIEALRAEAKARFVQLAVAAIAGAFDKTRQRASGLGCTPCQARALAALAAKLSGGGR